MNPLGRSILKSFSSNPSQFIKFLTESKNLATYRGSTSAKDMLADLHQSMIPGVSAIKSYKHQLNRAKLETKTDQFARKILSRFSILRSGNLSTSMTRNLIKDLKQDFQNLYHEAFNLGHGSSAAGLLPSDSHSIEDRRWTDSAFIHEMRYFNNFIDQALTPEMSEGRIRQRVDMYMRAVRGVYEAGRVVGSHPLSLIYWVYSPEAHHCPGCLQLQSWSPFTKRTLPCTPRNGSTVCLSNCKCHIRIVMSDTETVQEIESKSMSRDAYMRILQQMKRRPSGWRSAANA